MQTNKTSYASGIWDGAYLNGLRSHRREPKATNGNPGAGQINRPKFACFTHKQTLCVANLCLYSVAQSESTASRKAKLTHLGPEIFWGTLTTLVQKAFQVASSKQQERWTTQQPLLCREEVPLYGFMSAGYPNYQQQKQTNVTSHASWMWDGGYKWVKHDGEWSPRGWVTVTC